MRFLTRLTTLLIAVLLSACGGGGGSPGLSSGPKLSTAAPSTLIVPVGSANQYVISGGSAPYFVKNTDAAIAVGWVNNQTLTIGATNGGTTTVSVVDSGGSQVDIAVTVGSSTALYTTAPSSFTMAPNTTQTFKVGGGAGPYSVSSSNTSMVSVALNGSDLAISGVTIGSATLQIRDSAGATLSVSVTVGAVPLALSPTSASAFINSVVEVVVVGGTPPYRVGGYIPSAVSVIHDVNDPNKFLVTPLLVSSGLAITILDSQNSSAIFTLTVISGQPSIRLSPNALTVSEISRSPIALTVFGATGAVNAFSSDLTLFTTAVTTAVSSDNQTITTITLNPQNRCVLADTLVTITVIDANRAVATSLITVKDNGNTVITTTDTATPPVTTSVTLPCPS